MFAWCVKPQARISANPVSAVELRHSDRDLVKILDIDRCISLMAEAERFESARLAPYIALSMFCGLRPAEVKRLSARTDLIDLRTNVVRILESISKTKTSRLVEIRPNVQQWLERYGTDLKPVNFERDIATLGKACGLSQDVLRHSFCSYHLAMWGNFASESLEAGHSPEIARRHYLSRVTKGDAERFWAISPTT